MYTRDFLVSVKRKSLRRGIWFKALSSLDRGYYNLVCTVVNRVRSEAVACEVMVIMIKLRDALKSDFVRLVESCGVKRAWKASDRAMRWDNRGALEWKGDIGFARFHAMIELNTPSGWGI